jgi:FixJ family two-component response regulator
MTNQPARVLVADDEPRVREFLLDLLASQGYEVAVFATGAQLLDAVPTFHPDVIVVDMLMPGLSGADVLAVLRRAGHTVPVILISGHHITMPDGFFAFIKKPFNLRQLVEVVAAAVFHRRTSNA